MAKYLIQASYTAEGARGLLKDGGTKRQAAIQKLIESLGGRLEALYFTFGDQDAIVIADLPDNQAAAASSMVVAASGGARTKTTVLLTVADVDQAAHKSTTYTPPGR